MFLSGFSNWSLFADMICLKLKPNRIYISFIAVSQFYILFSRQEHQIELLQVSIRGDGSSLSVFSFSFTVHLQLFTNNDILQVRPESYNNQICSTLTVQLMAYTISKGLAYIIILYTITSFGLNQLLKCLGFRLYPLSFFSTQFLDKLLLF